MASIQKINIQNTEYSIAAEFDDVGNDINTYYMHQDEPNGSGSFSMNRGGDEDTVIGEFSSTLGYDCIASGMYAHAEGNETTASGEASHAEGIATVASGEGAHAEGGGSTASGNCSHAEGMNSQATEEGSHGEGSGKAHASYSHAEGILTTTNGIASHAEGNQSTTEGDCSHAEGERTAAIGDASHTEGHSTIANGNCAHAEGYSTVAVGDYSHAEGYGTSAEYPYVHVQGKYNAHDSEGIFAHIIGNGTEEAPSNAHTVDWDGNAWYAGDLQLGGNILQIGGATLTYDSATDVLRLSF